MLFALGVPALTAQAAQAQILWPPPACSLICYAAGGEFLNSLWVKNTGWGTCAKGKSFKLKAGGCTATKSLAAPLGAYQSISVPFNCVITPGVVCTVQ